MTPARSSRPAAETADLPVPPITDEGADSPGPARPSRRIALVAAVGAATVVLGAFGIWATVAAHDLRATAAAGNGALVDAGATASVTREVSSAVDTIFSYSYADTGRTRAAAQKLLTGAAIRQYDQLFALVEKQAPSEKLVVTTRVTSIGVEVLSQGRARLLVFANQQDTVTGTGRSSYGGAMFAVTAVRQGGGWKIANIDTFSGSS
jgi:Mce-associated membrane protein